MICKALFLPNFYIRIDSLISGKKIKKKSTLQVSYSITKSATKIGFVIVSPFCDIYYIGDIVLGLSRQG